MNLAELDIQALAAAVASGDVEPGASLDECLEKTRRLNTAMNAIVATTEDRYQQAVERIEHHENRSELSLAGVPFVVSESVALAGAPHTSGSQYRQGEFANADASAVRRLVEAGALPIGVSNTSEIGFWIETSNTVYGRTSSPYSNRHISGGGLGGAAAAVATGCARFGLGVDMVGSARLAAQACGVASLKPTGGLVPLTGFEPFPRGRMRRFAVMSLVARHARELEPLLRVVAGPDGTDGAAVQFEPPEVSSYDLLWKHVLVCEDMNLQGVKASKEVKAAVRNAAEILGERGAEVEDWRPRQFEEAFLIWLAMVHEGYGFMHAFQDAITCGEDASWMKDILRVPFGRSAHTAPILAMGLMEKVTRASFLRTQRMAAEGRRLQERLKIVLQNGGILLLPAYPTSTPKHGRSLRRFQRISYASIINALELPSVTVPIAMDSDGLPIAVQVIANRGREDACIAAASALQDSIRPLPAPSERKIIRSS
jgi:fatty acid amide hydrolase 2